MACPYDGPYCEQFTKAGEVLLTHNHIALLHGLLDRPNGVAASVADWVAAAMPYGSRYYGSCSVFALRRSLRTMNEGWVQRQRVGHCTQVTLLPRGRAILDRSVPARVRGVGAYAGLPKASPKRR